MIIERIVSLLIGYACGLLQTAYLYGRLNHIDIREHGSGNAGTTNALRTLGKKAGVITFLGDFCKPMVAALIAWLIFRNSGNTLLLEIYAGTGAVLGHIFPCYLKFKGGKGVATIAGMTTLFCFRAGLWYVIPVMMAVFVVVVGVTRYVSLGSLVIVTVYYIWLIVLGQTGHVADLSQGECCEIYVLVGIYTVVTIVKHRSNIVRLAKGTENKVFKKEN